MAGYGPGNWFGLPEFGITEKLGGKKKSVEDAKVRTQMKNGTEAQEVPAPTNNNTQQKTPTSGGGSSSGGSSGGSTNKVASIDSAGDSAKDAAAAAAEAARVAAMNAYQVVQKAGGQAKERAKGTYDWIIDTIGSNKQDLLTKISLESDTGEKQYAEQEGKTTQNYQSARGEILNTYRDLKKEQEKLLRGSGQAQSSRSLEAALKLNNLLSKDLNTLSTNEADSLAMIGNALDGFRKKILASNESIEKEANLRADQAGLQYQQQVDAIDLNMFLSEKEKEEAYANAEAKLKSDIASIDTWILQSKEATNQAIANDASSMDELILSLTDERGALGSDLNTKYNMASEALGLPGSTAKAETGVQAIQPGTKTSTAKAKYSSKSDLDTALLTGEISPSEYNTQLKLIEGGAGNLATNLDQINGGATVASRVSKDPLVSALFG